MTEFCLLWLNVLADLLRLVVLGLRSNSSLVDAIPHTEEIAVPASTIVDGKTRVDADRRMEALRYDGRGKLSAFSRGGGDRDERVAQPACELPREIFLV